MSYKPLSITANAGRIHALLRHLGLKMDETPCETCGNTGIEDKGDGCETYCKDCDGVGWRMAVSSPIDMSAVRDGIMNVEGALNAVVVDIGPLTRVSAPPEDTERGLRIAVQTVKDARDTLRQVMQEINRAGGKLEGESFFPIFQGLSICSDAIQGDKRGR